MKEALRPIWSTFKLILLLGVIAYPITAIIQYVLPGKATTFTEYNQLLKVVWAFLLKYGGWITVAILSLMLVDSPKPYYEAAEKIRERKVLLEMDRYEKTPYISPLHLFYLVAPPQSYAPDIHSVTFNRFYQKVVQQFRDRVYFNAKFNYFIPVKKPSLIRVVGREVSLSIFFCFAMVVVYWGLLTCFGKPMNEWFVGWFKFAIPFIVSLLSRAAKMIYASITVGRGTDLEKAMSEYFDGDEPRITWRELFPDTPWGEAIFNAWRADCDNRQRNHYQYRNTPVPEVMRYDSPALAQRPFPSDTIPDWADQMSNHYEHQLASWKDRTVERNREIAKVSGGKVVSFKKGKR